MGFVIESSLGATPDTMASRLQKLRTELKQWEKAFALANDGRKAGRDDIKQDVQIAQKYKDYNNLRKEDARKDSFVQTCTPSSPSREPKRRRRNSLSKEETPVKKNKYSKDRPIDIDPHDAPTILTPTATRTSVGPTPQRNGQVLGLFDMLTPSTGRITPSKSVKPQQQRGLKIDATPSKARPAPLPLVSTATPTKPTSTPLSFSNPSSTNIFTTPQPRRVGTPASKRRRLDETPDFLRRDQGRFFPSHALHQDGVDPIALGLPSFSPVAVRMPPRPAGKRLSALVKSLRNMEEDRLDEELELLQDMDQENMDPSASVKHRVQVQGSQTQPAIELPLGADGDGHSSEGDGIPVEELGRDGRPLRIYKKRGQKRTTRKVNIRPNVAKWKPEPEWKVREVEKDEKSQKDQEGHSEADGSDEDNEYEAKPRSTRKQLEDAKKSTKSSKARKHSATAHANFRALKIKKKGTKPKGGRFGRR